MDEPALWVGVGGFLAGTMFFSYRGMATRQDEAGGYAWIAALIAAVGAGAYLLLALGQGSLTVAGGRPVPWARYADWLVTVALVLAALGRLADGDRATVATLVGLGVLWIAVSAGGAFLAGGQAGFGVEQTRLGVWGLGGILLVATLAVLVGRLGPQAGRQHRDVAVLFSILRNLVVAAWIAYHLVWLLSPTWLGVLGEVTVAVAFVVIDLGGKVGLGLILLRDGETLDRA